MDILCIGLSHKTAPVELRERFAVGDAHLGEVSSLLAQTPGLREAVVISTCNRVEYYVVADDADGGALRHGLGTSSRRSARSRRTRWCALGIPNTPRRIACAIFSVWSSGLESDGPRRDGNPRAGEEGVSVRADRRAPRRGHLNKLFQRAFNVAKDVRTNTNITRVAA